jgi:hypothetical protein
MRRNGLRIGVVGFVLLATALVQMPAQQGDGGQSEVRRGFEIAPVPLNLEGKNRSLVGLGSLYSTTMGCVGCHTNPLFLPGGNPFLGEPTMVNAAGHFGGGAAFGPFISRNLTPDANGRPGGLTYEEFVEVMRHGTDFKGIPPHVPGAPGLLQVMPWPEYRHATDRTMQALYEYLRAIPCLEGGPGQLPGRCGP